MSGRRAAIAALLLLAACATPGTHDVAGTATESAAPALAAVASADAAPMPAPVEAQLATPAGSQQAGSQQAAPSLETVVAPPVAAPLAWPDPLPAFATDAALLQKGLLVGTWAADEPADFERSWIDESALRVVFTGESAGRRKWRGFAAGSETVPVDSLLNDREGGAISYVYSLLSRPTPPEGIADEAAVLHVRHHGRLRAWWDGKLVIDAPAPLAGWAELRVPVTLTGPYDVLLLKLARGQGFGPSMEFSVRASAADGSALPGQAWKTMRPPGIPTDLPPAEAPAAETLAPEAPASQAPPPEAPGPGN